MACISNQQSRNVVSDQSSARECSGLVSSISDDLLAMELNSCVSPAIAAIKAKEREQPIFRSSHNASEKISNPNKTLSSSKENDETQVLF